MRWPIRLLKAVKSPSLEEYLERWSEEPGLIPITYFVQEMVWSGWACSGPAAAL